MSEENVEIVRNSIAASNAFFRGELEALAEAASYDPQIEWHWHGERTFPDFPQHLRGGAEVIRALEQFRDAWSDHSVEALEFIEAPGDRVLTLIRQRGRGREGGVPVTFHYFFVWTIREGRVRNLDLFRHRAEALEAAGLSE